MADGLMDFSERCRLCIEPKRLSIDIFSEEGRRIKLKSKINKNLPLKVSQSDGLPSQICYQCLFRLETWVSFKQLCMERDQVMKTWSQSFPQDETFESGRAFNGGQITKNSKAKDPVASRNSRSHHDSREIEASHDVAASNNQMDDAKSDTSLWEVVKMDDTDNLDPETQDNEFSHNAADNVHSSNYCNISENASDARQDWNRRKGRKPSKVPSSESDHSNSNDMLTSGHPSGSEPVTSLTSSSNFKYYCSPQELTSSASNPAPLKRKRGRPSKAFLQRERELKKMREQEKVSPDCTINTSNEDEMDQSMKGEDGKDVEVETEGSKIEKTQNTHNHGLMPNFIPVERDNGSGVTEVLLDDPDFGCMKFTLSVVDIDSPESSPIPTDSYKYSNYASSCGNLSSDSQQREDFEGFESPPSSSYLKTMKDDSDTFSDEIPRSRSHIDVRLTDLDENLSPCLKRKRSNSASGDFRTNTSPTDEFVIHEHGHINGLLFESPVQKRHFISKSIENIDKVASNSIEGTESQGDRNAHSDGELSITSQQPRRKSLAFQGFDLEKHMPQHEVTQN